jgi:hypothetical protein
MCLSSDAMNYTFYIYIIQPGNRVVLLSRPLTVRLMCPENADAMAENLIREGGPHLHSIAVISEDSSIKVRWFQLGGRWRRRPSKTMAGQKSDGGPLFNDHAS